VKVVSEQLGHSSLGITADTYTSVLPAVAQAAAEAVASIVLRRANEPLYLTATLATAEPKTLRYLLHVATRLVRRPPHARSASRQPAP
jgi:hypothetical protein